MMHRAKIAQVPNGMGCDGRVPPRENPPEALGTSVLEFCCKARQGLCLSVGQMGNAWETENQGGETGVNYWSRIWGILRFIFQSSLKPHFFGSKTKFI